MNRFLLGAAAALSASMVPAAVVAATSGTVDATTTVTYTCDITFPSTATLTATDATTMDATSDLTVTQNGDTTYTLSALTLTEPLGAATTGTITVADDKAATIVTNSSTATTASGDLLGNKSITAPVSFQMVESTAATFTSGTYTISATLSCAEKV